MISVQFDKNDGFIGTQYIVKARANFQNDIAPLFLPMTESKNGQLSITDVVSAVKKEDNDVFTAKFNYNLSEVG